MLNLSQTTVEVKPTTGPIFNTLNPIGLSETYRQLKALGWTSLHRQNRAAHASIFELDGAQIYSLHNLKKNRTFILTIDDQQHEITGTPEQITNTARELQAKTEAEAKIESDLAVAAAELIAEHGDLDGRIQRGLELAEAGTVEFPHYKTRFNDAGGFYECRCPDQRATNDRLGRLCKHTIAQRLTYNVKHEAEAVANRRLIDMVERKERDQALPAYATHNDRLEDMLGYDEPQRPLTVAEQKRQARAGLGNAMAYQGHRLNWGQRIYK